MIHYRSSDGGKTVAAMRYRDANGLHEVKYGRIRTDSLHVFYSPLSTVTVSPSSASSYTSTKGPSSGYTNSVAVGGYSGTPSSIVWTVPSGWSVTSQGSSSTTFRSPSLPAGSDVDATGSVTVSFGTISQTASFDLYASNQGIPQ